MKKRHNKTPLILVNFKGYGKAIGKQAVALAKKCKAVRSKKRVNILVAVQAADIHAVAQTGIPVLAEHIDPVEPGARTGSIIPEDVIDNGAVGTLINHSEKKLSLPIIKKTVERAKKLKLLTVVCATTPAQAAKIAVFKPDFIAIEPPALIGGNISVSTANPDIITNTIKQVRKVARIPILCGAGVKTEEDVKIALQLGAKGILVASGVVNAKQPTKVLESFSKGTK